MNAMAIACENARSKQNEVDHHSPLGCR